MNGINWINHKGKEILYVQVSVAKTEEEVIALMNEATKTILLRPANTVLYITDMEQANLAPAAMTSYREGTEKINDHLKAWALIGLNPIKKMILEVFKKATKIKAVVFDTIDEAKDWLVEQ